MSHISNFIVFLYSGKYTFFVTKFAPCVDKDVSLNTFDVYLNNILVLPTVLLPMSTTLHFIDKSSMSFLSFLFL